MWTLALFIAGMALGGSEAGASSSRKLSQNFIHADQARYNAMSYAPRDGSGSKIYPNNDAVRNAFPFVVWLASSDGRHVCTGSLVDRQFVLTAAQCLGDISYVFLGQYDRSKNEADTVQIISVVKEIPHPNFSGLFSDIGLVKLATQARIRQEVGLVSMLKSKSLKRKFMRNRRDCMVLGWGLTQYNGTWYLAEKLQEQKTRFVGKDEAKERGWDQIPGFLYMEAEYEDEECPLGSICYGDSGGPTVCDNRGEWIQVGITSYYSAVDGCAFGIKGHTDIEYFIEWIEEIISVA